MINRELNQLSWSPRLSTICIPPQTDRHPEQPQKIHGPGPAFPAKIGSVKKEHDQRYYPNRHVDIKIPAPGKILRQVAPKHGANNGTQHRSHSKGRHGHAAFFARIAFYEYCLPHRYQRGSKDTLEKTPEHNLCQGMRLSAQRRAEKESGNAPENEATLAKTFHEKARQGSDNHHGQHVGGQCPCNLVAVGMEGPLHVRQGHIDNRNVEYVQDDGCHNRHRDRQKMRGGDPGIFLLFPHVRHVGSGLGGQNRAAGRMADCPGYTAHQKFPDST